MTSSGQIVITEEGDLATLGTSDLDCTSDAGPPQAVSCPAAGITEIVLSGGNLDDRLTNLTPLDAQAWGEEGHDVMRGGGGNERIEGGPGPDDIDGGGGSDLLYGATLQDPGAGSDTDQLAGGSGDDRLFGSGGTDHLDGGLGADQLEGAGGADDLHGGDGADSVLGGSGDDLADGGPGDDTVGTEMTLGAAARSQELGNDALMGGPGNDTINPGPGPPLPDADTITGGDGTDWVGYDARLASVKVYKDAAANDGGLAERDNVGLDVERITGSLASDTLRGGPTPDVLEGGPEADTLEGLAGDDKLFGDAGTGNTLEGSGGEDYVDGQRGRDQIEGGRRADVVAARDGGRDATVSCGPGLDFAIVDRRDRVVKRGDNRCERVDDGSQRKPTPGRVYVEPQRCGGSEDVGLGLPAMHRLVPLRYSIMIPSGSQRRRAPKLDVTDCPVRLTATPEEGRRASAGVSGAAVSVSQISGHRVTTMLKVKSPRCGAGAARALAAARSQRLRVNARGRRGRWRVLGRYSIGASFGTDWTTVEACSRTTTVVRRGRVQVTDLTTRRTVIVRAGQRYVSRAR